MLYRIALALIQVSLLLSFYMRTDIMLILRTKMSSSQLLDHSASVCHLSLFPPFLLKTSLSCLYTELRIFYSRLPFYQSVGGLVLFIRNLSFSALVLATGAILLVFQDSKIFCLALYYQRVGGLLLFIRDPSISSLVLVAGVIFLVFQDSKIYCLVFVLIYSEFSWLVHYIHLQGKIFNALHSIAS